MLNLIGRSARARRAVWAASILIVLCPLLYAQLGGGPGGGGPGDMPSGPGGGFEPEMPSLPKVDSDLEKLTRLLSLTSDQQTQVRAILTDEREQMKAAVDKAKSSNGPQNLWAAARTIRDSANTSISALLTADQTPKFASWVKKQEKSNSQGGDDMPPPPDGGGPPPGGGGPPPGGGGPSGL